MLPAVERWERDEIDRQFASLERDRRRLEEENRRTERRIWELELQDGKRIHLTYTAVIWAMLALLVAFEIVVITLKASGS